MYLVSKNSIITLEALYSSSFVCWISILGKIRTWFGKLWPASGRVLNNNPSYKIMYKFSAKVGLHPSLFVQHRIHTEHRAGNTINIWTTDPPYPR